MGSAARGHPPVTHPEAKIALGELRGGIRSWTASTFRTAWQTVEIGHDLNAIPTRTRASHLDPPMPHVNSACRLGREVIRESGRGYVRVRGAKSTGQHQRSERVRSSPGLESMLMNLRGVSITPDLARPARKSNAQAGVASDVPGHDTAVWHDFPSARHRRTRPSSPTRARAA